MGEYVEKDEGRRKEGREEQGGDTPLYEMLDKTLDSVAFCRTLVCITMHFTLFFCTPKQTLQI